MALANSWLAGLGCSGWCVTTSYDPARKKVRTQGRRRTAPPRRAIDFLAAARERAVQIGDRLLRGTDIVAEQPGDTLHLVEAVHEDVAHANDPDKPFAVEHRQMANVALGHHLGHLR